MEIGCGIERIWREYHAALHGFIQARVEDTAVADDILQDVFLRIHAKIDSLKDTAKIKSWIYQIARNAIIDHYRARKQMIKLPEELPAPEADDTDQVRRDIESCLLPMIRSLPDEYREAMVLSEIEGLTQKQVAERQELSLSGAKSRIQRGRARLKDMLTDCCRFEFDHRGTMVDYQPKSPTDDTCCP